MGSSPLGISGPRLPHLGNSNLPIVVLEAFLFDASLD